MQVEPPTRILRRSDCCSVRRRPSLFCTARSSRGSICRPVVQVARVRSLPSAAESVHRHDVRQVDLGRGRARQFDLRLLGSLLRNAAGPSDLCAGRCYAVFELVGHQSIITWSVVASGVRVAVGHSLPNTPSPSSRIEISAVPPPRSYTAILYPVSPYQAVGQRGKSVR